MNQKNFWIACLSGAAVSLLASNLPFIGFINCFLCGAFWGSAIFAVWLYQRLGETLTLPQALKIGALTGLIAGLVGFALSFLGLAGAQGFVNTARQFLPGDATQGMDDLPAWGAWLFNFFGVLFNIGFGTLGGWLGYAIFGRSRKPAQS